jgi:HK97 family phage prohead protease
MTETVQEIQDEFEDRESGLLHRTFAAEVTAGDGRTVDVRIVPYGERAWANDGGGGLARGVAYEEEFVTGVFSHQLKAANRVLANFEHQPGIGGVVGHGTLLREDSTGFYGSFRLHETADGDKALTLVKEGVLDGVSVEFAPVKSMRTAGGVVQRLKAHLDSIALCRQPAFKSAKVLAIREEIMLDDSLLPVQPDPEVLARLERLGFELPERYQKTTGDDEDGGELLDRAMAGEQKAVNRLEMMIAAANNYIADEPDATDKAAMRAIVAQLQKLHQKDTSTTG